MSQEEEDLINAHRKQVEETMDIVKEVCDYRVGVPPFPQVWLYFEYFQIATFIKVGAINMVLKYMWTYGACFSDISL